MLLSEFYELIKPEALKFFKENLGASPSEFALRNNSNKKIPVRVIAEQLACYLKAKKKIPDLAGKILFEKTALEQSTGIYPARYKQSLVGGKRLLDMTGGLGIDVLFFSEKFRVVDYFEQNEVLVNLFRYNVKNLNIKNVIIHQGDSVSHLEKTEDDYYDWIYIDPARRDEAKRSVDLNYCNPNIIKIKNLILSKAKNILIKISPAFEITEISRLFPECNKYSVLSVDNENKEILIFFNKNENVVSQYISAVCIDSRENNIKEFSKNNYRYSIASGIKRYFYDPDVAVKKARLVDSVASEFNLELLAEKSIYLTADFNVPDFPGRKFEVEDVIQYNPKILSKYFSQKNIEYANIAQFDFNSKVEEIRKQFKLKDGGEYFLFFTRDSAKNHIVIITKKIV